MLVYLVFSDNHVYAAFDNEVAAKKLVGCIEGGQIYVMKLQKHAHLGNEFLYRMEPFYLMGFPNYYTSEQIVKETLATMLRSMLSNQEIQSLYDRLVSDDVFSTSQVDLVGYKDQVDDFLQELAAGSLVNFDTAYKIICYVLEDILCLYDGYSTKPKSENVE